MAKQAKEIDIHFGDETATMIVEEFPRAKDTVFGMIVTKTWIDVDSYGVGRFHIELRRTAPNQKC
jgi:hypothetical protein